MGNTVNSKKSHASNSKFQVMEKADINIFKSPKELANKFADQLMNWIENHSRDEFHLAISGGKTPDLLFAELAAKYNDSAVWRNVNFWWVDERMVPPTHLESNFRIANNLLFSKISIPEENIHRVKGENDPVKEALSYSNQIQKKLPLQNAWPVFDLILLGMGDDGHTASIFPNQLELLNSENVCEVATHPVSGQKRVTLTGKVINQASKICFLMTGTGKAERLNEIRHLPEQAKLLPAFYVRNADWYVDEQAAKLIR